MSLIMFQSSLFVYSLVVFVAYQLYTSDFWGSLAKVPGPFLARITRLWELKAVYDGGWIFKHKHLHRKYGPVVRLGPNKYSIDDPTAVKTIYGHGSKFVKTAFYTTLADPNFPATMAALFPDPNIDRHRKNRREVANLYSMTTLRSYEPLVNEVSQEFCERLKGFASDGQSIVITDWLQYYAFDVIGKITLNDTFGFIQSGKDDSGVLQTTDDAMHYMTLVGVVPEVHTLIARFRKLTGGDLPLKSVRDWIRPRFEKRQAEVSAGVDDAHDDFAKKLVLMRQQGKVGEGNMWMAIHSNVVAGSDTTSSSLSAIVWFLAKNRRCLAKLQEEIREFEDAGKLSDPVTFQEAQSMPYLQAVIKESLRIHPVGGLLLPRYVPKGGADLCGYHFPEGTTVGSTAWTVNFDTQIYGADTEQFKPERWLTSPEKASFMENSMLTFGAGARTCIGKNISLLEMSKLIPQLYRRFDFELAGPIADRELDCMWFVNQKFTCQVKLRE